MKKNTLILNGQEYDLVKMESTSNEFMLEGINLGLPFIEHPTLKCRYKVIRIGNESYGVIPKDSIKGIPLDDNTLKNMFGWTYQHPEGLDDVYYKSFNGYMWFQITFTPENNNVVLSMKRIRKGVVEEQTLFNGVINSIDDFTYICNLLNIK